MTSSNQNKIAGLVASLLGFLFCILLYFWTETEAKKYAEEIAGLSQEGRPSFATILETKPSHRIYKRPPVLTYQVADDKGEWVEITEEISPDQYKKYRVGDTISVFKKSVIRFGRSTTLARIQGNQQPIRGLEFFPQFFYWGGILLLLAFGITFVFFLLGSRSLEPLP